MVVFDYNATYTAMVFCSFTSFLGIKLFGCNTLAVILLCGYLVVLPYMINLNYFWLDLHSQMTRVEPEDRSRTNKLYAFRARQIIMLRRIRPCQHNTGPAVVRWIDMSIFASSGPCR